MTDKYLSFNARTNGYTFANIGFFYGLGGAILSAVYSLILFDIFQDASIVGLYSSAFAVIAMLFAMFSSEIFKLLPKSKIFPLALVVVSATVLGMMFQPSAASFITLDVIRECAWSLLNMCLVLFMAEFAGNAGIARVNGRYYTLNNLGSIIAPLIALRVASMMDDIRAPLLLVSLVMLIALFYFKNYKITAADKKALPPKPKHAVRKVFENLREYLSDPNLTRAYVINFGYYAIRSIRNLYVPLAVIEAGFSKDTLGILLALGTIPFALLATPISRLARKYGAKWLLIFGYAGFAALAFTASFSTGLLLLGLFIAWQIPNAVSEPIRELPFYAATNKAQRSKFVGIFLTAKYLSGVLGPLLAAMVIFTSGRLGAVWILAAVIGLLAAYLSRTLKHTPQ